MSAERAIERLPEEAYAVLDRLDEQMISSELAGLIEYGAEALVYSFKIEGRQVTGLSWPGAKALARWMAEKGHPLDAAEKEITQDEETWYADVKIVDKATGLGLWGTSKARKMKQVHVVDENRNWVKNPDGSWQTVEKPDEHSRTIALNKSQRNAILAHVPDKMIAQFIQQAIDEGKIRKVPPDEVESHRQRKQVDSEEVKQIKEQARRDREERLAKEARAAPPREEAPIPEEPEPEETEIPQEAAPEEEEVPVPEPDGPPGSVEEVRERLAKHIVTLDEWIVVSDRDDFFRVGKIKRLEEEMEYTVDELVRRMGGEWDDDSRCWKIPKEA